MGIVVDTSALFKLFYKEDNSDKMDELMQLLIQNDKPIFSIDLILYELGQIVLKKHRMKAVMARDFPQRLEAMNIEIRFPDEEFLRSVMDISKNLNTSFYDACFIAISERMDLPLITEDNEILRKYSNSMNIPDAYQKFSEMLM
jgi:predicted nucleic acid-binding protein